MALRTTSILIQIYRVLYALIERFVKEGVSYRAASLVYTTLLALIPMAIVMFTILSAFHVFQGLWPKIQTIIFHNFVPSSAQIISEQLQKIMGNMHSLSWVNIIFLFVVCVLLLYNISYAFDAIWQAEHRQHIVVSFLIYFLLILLMPVFIAIVLLSTAWIVSIPFLSHFFGSFFFIKRIFLFTLPYFMLFFVFAFINWILPSHHVRLRDAAMGGLVATIFFEIAKNGFVIYLKHFPTYHILYGALAIIPIFLLWLYISWVIILFGAVISHASSKHWDIIK